MSNHLLTCTCGASRPVSTSQAGESIACACGATLAVPTLRELRALPLAQGTGAASAVRVWGARQRGAFVLICAAVCGLVVAGVLYSRFPQPVIPPSVSPAEVSSAIDQAKPEQLHDLYRQMRKGLPQRAVEPDEVQKERLLTWGFRMTLVASIAGLLAGLIVLWTGGQSPEARSTAKRKHEPQTRRASQ